jgi:hypothetical protein
MKILHINNFNYPDYQNDMVYHGGKTLFKDNYETSSCPVYMHQNYPNISKLYGKGFTIYGKLPPLTTESNDIVDKIKNKYFDYIIYGSIFRDSTYFDIVSTNYDKNHIVFIDGEDHQGLYNDFIGKGHYFKRELIYDETDMLHHIGFGIPECGIIRSSIKNQIISKMNPMDKSSYIFNTEKEYYNEYNKSFFAITCKKAGWDCLRHYEIIMSHCVPHFIDLEKCPTNTMKHFPKKMLLDYNNNYKTSVSNFYHDFICNLQQHLVQYCTTKSIFNYILEKII